MRHRRLGHSGLVVSEICIGTMTFGNQADEKTSFAILDRAAEAGVDFIDVAEIYPVPPDRKYVGRSEEIVGQWLRRQPRDRFFLATKVAGPGYGWFLNPVREGTTALDRHHIVRAVEGSLRRLRTDYIDLYQTHWPDRGLPFEETLEALTHLVQSGKVRYAGCSNENAWGLMKSLWTSERRGLVRYATIQNHYNLLHRAFEQELAEVCRHEQISLLAYSPLAGGVLSGKYNGGAHPPGARFTLYRDHNTRTRTMYRRFVNERTLAATAEYQRVAGEAGLDVCTLAIAWTLSRPFVGAAIIGATHPEQLEPTLAAADVRLTDDVLRACDEVWRRDPQPMSD